MSYSPAELQFIAEQQIAYEVRTLFGQVDDLMRWGGRDRSSFTYLALVEAPLVHLRLLDDFLGCDLPKPKSRNADDVVARHYDPDWTPNRFLDEPVRRRINAQLQHLVSRRTVGADWYFMDLLSAFAHRFLEFANALAGRDVDRHYWFEESISECMWFTGDEDKYPNIEHGS